MMGSTHLKVKEKKLAWLSIYPYTRQRLPLVEVSLAMKIRYSQTKGKFFDDFPLIKLDI